MKYSEKWGDSVEIAVDLALADLGLTREQVEVTVLEQPSKGFFGIGSKLAKVRVEEKAPEKPEIKAEKPREEVSRRSAQEKSAVKKARAEDSKEIVIIEKCGVEEAPRKPERTKNSRNRRTAEPESEYPYEEVRILGERPKDLEEQPDHPAKKFLEDVVAEMGLKVGVKVYTAQDSVYADLEGEDAGTVIGKRGATLDAIQYLASLVVNKDRNGYIRVVVDAEGYRQKREKTLERLANRLADKAAGSGRSVRLEPMNPYERKVIHTTLQGRKEVSTRSEGEEPYRRVIVEPVK